MNHVHCVEGIIIAGKISGGFKEKCQFAITVFGTTEHKRFSNKHFLRIRYVWDVQDWTCLTFPTI